MKKNLLLLLLSMQIFSYCYSQSEGLRLGATFGIGEARIRNANINNQTGKLALLGGLAMTYQFSENFGLYSNLLFTNKGSRSSETETVSGFFGTISYPYEEKFNLYYVEVPLMPKISIGFNNFYLKAFAGPSINFNILGKQDKIYEDQNYNEQNGYTNRDINGLTLVEYSIVFGGGVDVQISDQSIFLLEIRENIALNSFGKINAMDASNQYFTIGLGYIYKY